MVEIFCRKDFRSEFLWYGFSLVWLLLMYPVVILETTKDERKKLIIIIIVGQLNFKSDECWINRSIKGVLHPRPVFGLFLHFSQKLQYIGDK